MGCCLSMRIPRFRNEDRIRFTIKLLSDNTRKERRTLLALGFVGIIVAQFKIYPTQIDVLGLKFDSPDLPFIAVSSLCLAIAYFTARFSFSCLYEVSASYRDDIVAKINAEETAIQFEAETTFMELDAKRERRRRFFEEERIQTEERIKVLQEKINQEEMAVVNYKKVYAGKTQSLESLLYQPSRDIQPNKKKNLSIEEIQRKLQMFEEEYLGYVKKSENIRKQLADELEREKSDWNDLENNLTRDLAKMESIYDKAHWNQSLLFTVSRRMQNVYPLHICLEIWLPILLGVVAIGSLVYRILHFSSHPIGSSLPVL